MMKMIFGCLVFLSVLFFVGGLRSSNVRMNMICGICVVEF